MEFLTGLITNKVFLSAAASWFIAQMSKIIIEIAKGEFTVERLRGGGGMPSSHSATVTGLACAAAFVDGGNSTEFVLALFLAFIVMYDAMGVRYETGREAAALNELNRRIRGKGGKPLTEGKMDERIGHTLPQIIAGMLIGIATASILCNFLPF